jgi:cell division control protein 6
MNYTTGQSGIIADLSALSEDYIPECISGRETQLKEIRLCLGPVSRNYRPMNLWIYGPAGVGKTTTVKFLLKSLEKPYGIKTVYVNCWERRSFYSVLNKVISELRILGAERPDTSFKMERLERQLKEFFLILVLDEIDRTPPGQRASLLYSLCQLERVGVVCISSERDTLFDLDDRIKSRLNATQVEFKPYTASDLFQILKIRAEMALLPKTWDKELLEKISGLANGDARVAIQTLKNAAYYAERSGAKRIFQEHLDKGWKDARAIKRNYLLNKLADDHRILFEIVRQKKEIISGDLWAAYLSGAADRGLNPIAVRTFSEYMNKLRDVGLVKVSRARVRGKVRLFKVVE